MTNSETTMFSVVIPAYNRAETILSTLNSVREQTLPDFECIVVDDGSVDGDALRDVVVGMNDPRFSYIHQENGGGGAARNTGIRAARGRYIAFLDSDDFFLSHKLAYLAAHLPASRNEVVYTQNLVDRGASQRLWLRPERAIRNNERVSTYLFVANQFIQTSTIMMDSDLAREVMFDPTLRKGQDLDFCVRLEAAGATFRMLEEPLSIWTDRAEGNRTSRTRGYDQPEAWLEAHKHMMTRQEIWGYKATSLSYYWGWAKPLSALVAIVMGMISGVSVAVGARQLARTFLPRTFYRQSVDAVVGLIGRVSSKSGGAS